MKSRILSLAAIAGMLVATGCSGGGAGVTGVKAPVAPPTGGTPAKGTSSITASFDIPFTSAQAAALSAGRNAKYLSPGTSGITVLLGDGSVAIGSAGLTGTAQLTGSVSYTGVNNQTATVTFLSASNSTPPVQGQTLTITRVQPNAAGNPVVVGDVTGTFLITAPPQANGTILTGQFTNSTPSVLGPGGVAATAGAPWTFTAGDLVTFTPTGASATGQQPIIGNLTTAAPLTPTPVKNASIPSTIFGATANSTYSYSFAPSTQLGYFTFSLSINALTAGKNYVVGVVTSDVGNPVGSKNFALSEAQDVVATPAAGGQSIAAFTLAPIVNGVYVPAPALVFPLTNGSLAAAQPLALNAGFGGTYETTVFATDEAGFVIPSTSGAVADNGPAAVNSPFIVVKPTTAAQATFKFYSAPAGATGALTTPPTAGTGVAIVGSIAIGKVVIGTVGGATDYASQFGTYFTGVVAGTPPSILGASTNTAGNPVNILCGVATSGVGLTATITSIVPTALAVAASGGGAGNGVPGTVGPAVGYTFTPGTNYPANSIPVALPSIDCTPGIGAVIN